jgi:hypothetical protein
MNIRNIMQQGENYGKVESWSDWVREDCELLARSGVVGSFEEGVYHIFVRFIEESRALVEKRVRSWSVDM